MLGTEHQSSGRAANTLNSEPSLQNHVLFCFSLKGISKQYLEIERIYVSTQPKATEVPPADSFPLLSIQMFFFFFYF